MRARDRQPPRWERLLRSRTALCLALALLLVLGGLMAVGVRARGHDQVVTAAAEEGRVIARLTASRDVDAGNVTEPLTVAERQDLDGDVAQLVDGGRLVGLWVRRVDGTVLYARGSNAPLRTDADGRLAAPTDATVSFLTTPRGPAITIVLPLALLAGNSPDLLVGVTIPAAGVTGRSVRASGQLGAAIVLALLCVGGLLVSLRQRIRLREHQFSHDPLTGLGNRTLLGEAASRLLARHEPFALMVMDLDGFRRINDTLGHTAGDEFLCLVADALLAGTREGDVLTRVGGNSFAVLIPGIGADTAHDAARRLLAAAQHQFTVGGVLIDCDASVGFALASSDRRSPGDLLQAAELAMYDAKNGKLGIAGYADSSGDVGPGNLQLLAELRSAISDGELCLHYQPTVSLRPGVPAFVEALVRWQHPVRGMIAPGVFIPLAEDTALIHPLTAWVLDTAVAQGAQWRLDGLDIRIAVNISPRSLSSSGIVQLVTETLARHRLPAGALELEITESAIIARPEEARRILQELRQLGVSLSIDDFGAGYTSLAYLKEMPIDTLKIDRAFISDLLTSSADRSVVASIIGLGHGLGLHVVAEGIEDGHTLRLLTQQGCDIAQGFHLSRPLPSESATQWLRQDSARAASHHGVG